MKSSESEPRLAPEVDLAAAIARCWAVPAALADLRAIYERVDRAVAGAELTCIGGGGCCKFDLAEHRLCVSVLELALLMAEAPQGLDSWRGSHLARARRRRCPYQLGPGCAAYAGRPLGCRTFFCSTEKKLLLSRIHEHFHGRIRLLHQTYCVPYAYGDLCDFVVQFSIYK